MSMQDDNLNCDAELVQLKESFQKQSKFGKSSFLRKIRGLFDATSNFVAEPAVQKNTRGRPKNTDKEQKTNPTKPSKFVPQTQQPTPQPQQPPPPPQPQPQPQPHRYSSYVDHSSSRYSSYVDPEPSRHSSYVNSEQYSSFVDPEPRTYNSYTGPEPPMYNSYTCQEPPMYNSYMKPEPPNILDPLVKAIARNYQSYVRNVHNVIGDGNN